MYIWDFYKVTSTKDIEDQIVSTEDLSGCTVLIVASPLAVIMIHIWERRDNDIVSGTDQQGWLYDPTGAKQQAKDMEFAEKGKELLTALLMSCVIDIATGEHKVPSIENGYNGWYPYDTTSVFVIGPGANPEYEQPNSLWRNPWYTDPTINTNDDSANTIRQIYPNAAKTLIKMAEALVIPNAPDGRSKYYTYKRRYSNDPLHHTDDSEFIVLKPKIMSNGEVWTVMYWDDDKSRPIVRMA
ncbi:hypothetical protein GQ43DRAFT_439846 [Delitschia confertaspora ATCC 74209]|uniref:Uncharacterized protein n=1 Tax=Delitschia confertaspora ATCC 74209 TaxID=1513339 RepID=A0A9P4JMI9_9PLEO|nr:hypothetical protein GQ43DRAFT_439846 [Delitschia confertaspora ATCC 74209]